MSDVKQVVNKILEGADVRQTINEGFIQDLFSKISGSKDNDYVNKGKEYLDSLPKTFGYGGKLFTISWGDVEQQKFGELGDVIIKSKDKLDSCYAICVNPQQYDDNIRWDFIFKVDGTDKCYTYKTKGWYVSRDKNTGDGNIEYDLKEIGDLLVKINKTRKFPKEGITKLVVNRLMEGADVRGILTELRSASKLEGNRVIVNINPKYTDNFYEELKKCYVLPEVIMESDERLQIVFPSEDDIRSKFNVIMKDIINYVE